MADKKIPMRNYEEFLYERLKDPEYALGYLNATLMDDEQRVFLQALKDVLHAQGGDMSKLAQVTNLNRENLYRMLSDKGNPRLSSLRAVLSALGLGIRLHSMENVSS